MRIKTLCRVIKIEERFMHVYLGGLGDTAAFRDDSLGWWLTFDSLGGNLTLYLGIEKPPAHVQAGATAQLTLEILES
jgi:hypothetical protein